LLENFETFAKINSAAISNNLIDMNREQLSKVAK